MKDLIRSVVAPPEVSTKEVRIETDLKKIPVWKYAKCVDVQESEPKNEVESINKMCTILELMTGTPAFRFRNDFNRSDVIAAYKKASQVIINGLPSDPIINFTFSTITVVERLERDKEARRTKNLFSRASMLNDIQIDLNREYKLVTTDATTFQQFILSEELNKKIFTDEARVQASDINAIAGILAYVYRVDGDTLWRYDDKEAKYIFNMELIEKRKKIFKNLDIATAWAAYNGFFLSVSQS